MTEHNLSADHLLFIGFSRTSCKIGLVKNKNYGIIFCKYIFRFRMDEKGTPCKSETGPPL